MRIQVTATLARVILVRQNASTALLAGRKQKDGIVGGLNESPQCFSKYCSVQTELSGDLQYREGGGLPQNN